MTLVFDYDGTLHNTMHLYGCAFRKAYAMLVQEGYAPERLYRDEDVSHYLGVSAPDMWNSFMPDLPKEVKQRGSAIIGQELIEGICRGEAILYDGIPEALNDLKRAGHRLLILSNCRHAYMEAHRSALSLDRWFTDYFCAEDYGFIPKQDIFPILCERYPDRHYLVIGDRLSDIQVGLSHHVPTIGCRYGFGTPEELSQCSRIIDSPSALVKTVEIMIAEESH